MATKKSNCAFGDSIMRGVVEDEDTVKTDNPKYKLLDDNFVKQCSDSYHINISNFARFGSTVDNGLKQLQRHIDDIQPESYVFLEFGGNDSAFNWQEVSDHPDDEHLPMTSLQHFKDCYSQIIDRLRDLGAYPILLSLPAIDAKKYFHTISRNRNFLNIRRWMNEDINHIVNWHETYNLAVFELAIAKKVPVIDISTIFMEKRDFSSYLCDDGIHPNEKGHALIVEAIKKFVSTDIPEANEMIQHLSGNL